MTTYQILCLFGVQALFTTTVTGLAATLIKKGKKAKRDEDVKKCALQALLRDRLYQLYAHCKEKDGATVTERENFENMYTWYHSLGENGVMDDTRNKFLALSIVEED